MENNKSYLLLFKKKKHQLVWTNSLVENRLNGEFYQPNILPLWIQNLITTVNITLQILKFTAS